MKCTKQSESKRRLFHFLFESQLTMLLSRCDVQYALFSSLFFFNSTNTHNSTRQSRSCDGMRCAMCVCGGSCGSSVCAYRFHIWPIFIFIRFSFFVCCCRVHVNICSIRTTHDCIVEWYVFHFCFSFSSFAEINFHPAIFFGFCFSAVVCRSI